MTSDIDLDGFDLEPAEEPRAAEASQGRKPGKIYTFYSFKGGVGRSMALANIAVLVAAQGKKVLIVDFDLEAPGLEHFFYKHDTGLRPRLEDAPGVIDLLGSEPPDWRSARCAIDLDLEVLSVSPDRGADAARRHIDIIHSGRASRPGKVYTDRVQGLNWTDLYRTHDIGTRFGQFRAEWISEYDFVFIDSRTGVTDIGDLCTVVLPDHLLLLFVTNQQNIDGIASIYRRAVTEHRRLPFERSRLTVLPVLSRDEFYSENKLSREWRKRAADQLAELFADWLPEDLRPIDAFQKIFIPYFAIWSFGEALPVLDEPDAAANPSSINASYFRIARLILHDLDWASLDEIADPAEVASTRISQRLEIEEERKRLEEEIDRQRAAINREEVVAKRSNRMANLAVFIVLLASGYFAWNYFANQDLNTELARYEEQATALQRENDSATQEAEKLRSELVQTRAQLDARSKILSDARAELETTNVELENSRQQVKDLRARTAELEAQVKSLSVAEGEAVVWREQLEQAREEGRKANQLYLETIKNCEQIRLSRQQAEDRLDDYVARIGSELAQAAESRTCQSDVRTLQRLLQR